MLKVICGGCAVSFTGDKLVFKNKAKCRIGVRAGLRKSHKWTFNTTLEPDQETEIVPEKGEWEMESVHIAVPPEEVKEAFRGIMEELGKDEFLQKILGAFGQEPEDIHESFAEGLPCDGHEAEFVITA